MGMVELSPVDREYCRDVTLQVLDRTLHDYADTASWASGSSSSDSDVEHEGWKKLRSQGNVSMFAEKTTDLRWMTSMRGGGVYGLVASDPAEFKVEAITAPSEGEPFEFMGVTRYVDNHGCFHRPHEYVLVVATGEIFTSCGEHLGYQICQSVSLSQWPVTNTAIRKRVIQARVLRELPDGSVGVYYKIIVDSRSFVPESVVQASLWRVVQDFWKMAPRCADAKKLYYCVEHKDVLNLSGRRSPCGSTDHLHAAYAAPLYSKVEGGVSEPSHVLLVQYGMALLRRIGAHCVRYPVLKVALLFDATTRAN
ncbi:hypothetical protein GQ600_1575 [Phytophthora cactorum]|nr:hypothetical protein GQ600_1575 [Phytophthora cactorum]